MSDSSLKLIAGLGNPGKDYARTRHNIGFLVVDALASDFSLELNKSRFESAYVKGKIKGLDLFLIKPMSYMNRSGGPVQKFASYYKIQLPNIIIVHDDMDLDFGKIKIVQGRGHGGHNGVRSIIDSFGRKECIRVRVGVGHPGGQRRVTGHVLGRFTPDEQNELDATLEAAVKACLLILDKGITHAMNRVNTRR
ncbi:MAG: aminoacyl-tRNA hydrolase [Desulfobacteraceae bacterium]|nr:aminoacyl-tRNA hydrolase [Desulfobacteraceae bacterium]